MKGSLPDEIDKNYVLQNCLKTQTSHAPVTNVGNLTAETNVESGSGSLEESPSNNGILLVKNEPVATPSKINPTDETTCSPKREPAIPTPKSLNLFAPEFEASPFPRYNPYYTVDYKPYKHQEAKTSHSPYKSTIKDLLTRLADILSQGWTLALARSPRRVSKVLIECKSSTTRAFGEYHFRCQEII